MKADVKILNSKDALATFAADWLAELSGRLIARSGRFNVALSGGSTPAALYQKLRLTDEIKWSYFTFFWSDERFVPFDHPESNAGNAYRMLLQPLGIDKERFCPVPTHYSTAHLAAMEYEACIRSRFGTPEQVPSFDLIVLGLGSDGHTASLFPETQALQETRRIVTGNWVEKLQNWRITFTYPLINQARHVVFLVSGRDKAGVVRDILKLDDQRHPAARVQPVQGKLLWMLDADAAGLL